MERKLQTLRDKYDIPTEWREDYELKEFKKWFLTRGTNNDIIARALLDSSLITRTNSKKYTIKILKCGDYYQVYYYKDLKIRKEKGYEKDKLFNVDNLFLNKKNIERNSQSIEIKNIKRSKFSLQRLAKANEDKFKTFITLTFAENETDLTETNKKLANWIRQVKRLKKDFAYICVPEIQKKRERKTGFAVIHYHLMTNLDIKQNPDIIIPQKNFTETQVRKMSLEQRKKCYDLKYWKHGFASVYPILTEEVVGYLTKYFSKDIDNRFFGRRRYMYSLNLNKVEERLIDLSNDSDFSVMADIVANSDICYEKVYLDVFENPIEYIEYKRNNG